ncbi:DUF3575 domain-containing protein [Gillisia sp. Hel_I_29]|uniref:DUF3575 domain-containing protein n=1 Tax=Gillisia sp. Hel_I_29 TaxID=1249975 RepID=UPI00055550EA|nr:DUF3575 domain-containing protein [Gillisia sp. Hel_I_29]
MKKILLMAVMLFTFIAVKAQNNSDNHYDKKNELKVDVIQPLIGGSIEAIYERNLNNKSSLGISGLYMFSEKFDEDMNYSITPYYRRFLGKKYAVGFFVEGFGMFSSIDGKKIYETEEKLNFTEGSDVYDLSLGLGLGSKWVTKNGFIFEINAGYGKQLFNADKTDHNQVIRYGIKFGYRF